MNTASHHHHQKPTNLTYTDDPDMDKKLRDFSNVAEKDCVRLIIAQDLKEFGIDVDTNLGGGLGNLTTINQSSSHRNSSNLNGTSSSHFHNNSLSHHTLGSNLKEFITSSKNHNKSTISSNLNLADHTTTNGAVGCMCNLKGMNPHDSHVCSSTTRVFNLSLSQLELASVTILEQTLNVPIFLKYSVDFLVDLIHIEGIFRRNGTASRLKELKKQVEEGIYNFEKFAIFDVTSLFKQFFRELPESLLTFALYSNFIQAVKLDTTKSKLESILNLCLQLPELNLNVLIYLMNFLKRVTLQETSNKMNSFNLAVCFAPNIIYTKVNKCNDLYINEERIVVQLLIENSSSIGKISDSVYERSLMLNSLCCSTTMMTENNTLSSQNHHAANNANNMLSTTVDCVGVGGSSIQSGGTNSAASVSMNINPTCSKQNSTTMVNNELLFLYDNDLQESSFAHHGQSAGSTSLSSYCGSSTSKKEKKKRRSSSLKELMNTIQNSISKFRRRSASEKNDKTTCSIITCSSLGNGMSAINNTGAGDLSCTSRICYDDKQRFLCDSQMPYIGGSSSHKQMLTTPICSSLYATPRINKRNAEDSLQSTTKKKLMEKLPQRNLLLPNAPITPFSTTKKSKHPFKQLLSTSEATCNSTSTSKSSSSTSGSANTNNTSQQQPVIISSRSSKSTDELSSTGTKVVNLGQLQTPQTVTKNPATPSTLTSQSVNQNPAIISLQKQLKYDESPSSSLKLKLEKNSDQSGHDCRRRLEMLPSSSKHHTSSCSNTTSSSSHKHHNHHHHSHHHHSHHHHREHREHRSHHSSSKSHHHRNSNSSAQHHHYVNAIPSPSSRYGNSNRYINQSDLCTKIISGNYIPAPLKSSNSKASASSDISGSSSGSSSDRSEAQQQQNQKYHNHTSACCGAENSKLAAERSAIDNSMRCTLRRGRPNTPKTGLSVDYRIRKSSVPNTPECTHLVSSRINHTISSDEYKLITGEDLKKNLNSYIQLASNNAKNLRSKSNVVVNLSTSSLNTAIIDVDDVKNSSCSNLNNTNKNANSNPEIVSLNESNNSRLLDMAFNEDDIEDSSDDIETNSSGTEPAINSKQHPGNVTTTTTSSSVQSCSLSKKQSVRKLSRSLSLSNLPDSSIAKRDTSPVNITSVSDNSYPVIKKSVSDSLAEKKITCLNEADDAEAVGDSEVDKKTNESVNESMMKAISLEEKEEPTTDDKAKPTTGADMEIKSTPEKAVIELSEPKLGEETFKFRIPDAIESDDENMLQNVLRRQSLFKLKEKINGKVSKQISEIERRKLSPYRFSNSPLKQKKLKEQSTSKLATKTTKRQENTICKLGEIPEEQYFVKNSTSHSSDKLSTTIATSTVQHTKAQEATVSKSSPFRKLQENVVANVDSPTRLIRAAANKYFYKKFSKARNIKRLNATTQATGSPHADENGENACPNRSLQQATDSPVGKGLLGKWKSTNETDVL